MVLAVFALFIYSLSTTIVMGELIAKAEEPPVGVVVNDAKLGGSQPITTTATPTPAPTPEPLSEKQEILSYIVAKFGDRSPDAIVMLRKCENSKFNQEATNHNNNGTTDYGIFQVNSIHEKRYGSEFKTDWKSNIDTAFEIYKSHGYKFTAWSCANWAGDKSYKD
jgi:hypothetical protein